MQIYLSSNHRIHPSPYAAVARLVNEPKRIAMDEGRTKGGQCFPKKERERAAKRIDEVSGIAS